MTVSCRRSTARAADARSIEGEALSCKVAIAGEQFAAVAPEHHAEFLQILGSELGERLPIDLIVAEGKLVSLEAEATQPDRYVHQAPSNLAANIWDCAATAVT